MPELHLFSPAGFRGAAVHAGLKSRQKPDLGLLVCDTLSSAAGAFTTNRVVSPAVMVGQAHIASGKLRGVVVNSGNANACTGKQGLRDARRMCELAAELTSADVSQFLPSSTGIIGRLLPMEKIERGITEAAKSLGDSLAHANSFADAILTTDTQRKTASATVKIGRRVVTLAGVCKGSGMIGPRLLVGAGTSALGMGPRGGPKTHGKHSVGLHATMLAYLTTDASIAAPLLRKMLQGSVDVSFNTVTVDDHASTNDTALVLASGASGARITSSADRKKFADALNELTQSLAYQIAADGEGATKVVSITVARAIDDDAAGAMARTIANSPLVKCAMNGNDPNWGRIVSAAGYAGVLFDAEKCTLTLQGTPVFRAGRPLRFDGAKVSAAMKASEVKVHLDCRDGKGQATVWTCDLSKEYVTINADYHT
jgi:glutamate N-acetyltransferase/amino-acid N-acetyltransferase